MNWPQVRQAHPDQWLVIEALEAHSVERRRILDRIAVVETCPDGQAAMRCYRQLHREHPLREFYFVHTSRDELEILESPLVSARRLHAESVGHRIREMIITSPARNVVQVYPLDDYRLEIEFENGEQRVFDVKPYLPRGIFIRLQNPAVFRAARVVAGSVEWPGGLDLSYDTLYLDSQPIVAPVAEDVTAR